MLGPPSGRFRLARRLDPTVLLIVTGIAVATLFVGAMLAATDGHFVPQVVDLYVIGQYARAMAEGHPFQYNAGEPPSMGATSLLHTAWLAAGHAAGFRGEWLVAFAVATGIALYLGTVALARRLGRRLGGEREGLLAGALVALGGPVVWGFLYGSDIALFLFLCLWLLERMVAAWATGAVGGAVVAGTLVALARPEGLLLAMALGLAWTLGSGRTRRHALVWVPTAAGLALLLAMRLVTGTWIGSSVADKSLVASYGIVATAGAVADYAIDVVRGLLLGFYPSQTPVGFNRGWASLYFPPLGLVLVLVALVHGRAPERRAARWWAGSVAAVALALSPNLFLGVQFNRYVLWAVPGLLVLVAVGLGALTRLLSGGDPPLERSLFRAGAGLFIALGALSTVRFAVIYGDMAGEVYRRDVAAAEWITRHLPRGAGMANLATSVEYLTGHRNLNLHGVTSPAFFGGRATERDAGSLAGLARLSAAQRPPYLITTRSAVEGSATVRAIVDGPPLFRTASGGDEIEIYRVRYDLVGTGAAHHLPQTAAAVAGLREVDRLNVGDARDEAAHRYRVRSRLGRAALGATVRVESYATGARVADTGRAVLGSEAFDVRTTPGRDLVLVLRTAPALEATVLRLGAGSVVELDFPEAALAVKADGRPAGDVRRRPAAGWDEWVLRLPGSLLRSERTRLEIAGRYASFYYWAYQ
ncbi:MAG TPA: hypothetical protein VMT87_15280 [Vicinamibacteria bacterium]|nr:hypothetical protein [Vicinamibacteria bacterium]